MAGKIHSFRGDRRDFRMLFGAPRHAFSPLISRLVTGIEAARAGHRFEQTERAVWNRNVEMERTEIPTL
jgi:hypothetical protein